MELRHLKTLVAIADHGTFSAAGEVIGLTQSAVSLHVKALEDAFSTPLFDRRTRPPILNAQGRELVENAREILERCAQAKSALTSSKIAGSLELGAVPSSLTGIIPLALVDLKSAHPDLRINVCSGLSDVLSIKVRNGDLDAAVVTEPVNLPSDLRWTPVAREPFVVIAPKGMRGKKDRDLLENQPFIQFSTKTWAGQQIARHLQMRKIKTVNFMDIDSLEAIGLMVSLGLGVSVVPLRCGAKELPYELENVPFGSPQLFRVIGVLERADNPRARLVQALLITLMSVKTSLEVHSL